jgi:glycerol-3-phosphate dehydrogenase (NAD(P)+)
MRHVTILGAGGMGTVLAMRFARTVPEVWLWSRDAGHARDFARTRVNQRHLPGVRIPDSVRLTSDGPEATSEAELIVAAIPTSYLRATLGRLAGGILPAVPVLSVVKGIEYGTFACPSQIIVEVLGPRPVCVLSGPSHAEELARGLPASVVLSGADGPLNERIRDLLSHETFRL